MGRPVPTASSKGWIYGVAEKADALFAYFQTTEPSQSNLFHSWVVSLPGLIQKYSNDFPGLIQEAEIQLKRMYESYFDRTNVTVRVVPADADLNVSSARYDLQISMVITDDGTDYSLGSLLTVVNSRINAIKKLEFR